MAPVQGGHVWIVVDGYSVFSVAAMKGTDMA
jgi:hypothetical protein